MDRLDFMFLKSSMFMLFSDGESKEVPVCSVPMLVPLDFEGGEARERRAVS